MRGFLVAGLLAVACRPPPQQPWMDEDVMLGQLHAASSPAPAPAPDDAGTAAAAPDAAPTDPLNIEVFNPRHDGRAIDPPEHQAPIDRDRARIAILLPLSGPFAPLGRELRTAIELAPDDGADRMFLDTQGDPEIAARMVDRAAMVGVVAILGPVGVRESASAISEANRQGVPIAVLAPIDLNRPLRHTFQLVESPQSEARAAAAVAAALGTPTAGVLAPADDVGQAAAAAFIAAATAAGITITAQGTYDPEAKDLQADVKTFLGLDPTINPRLAAHLRRRGKRGWTTFSPDVPFALLYVPDRHDRAAIVASFFPYLGVELRTADFLDPDYLRRKHGGRIPQVVQLLGSSGWNHATLATRGGPAVEGAYFIEPCPGLLGDPSGAELFTALQSRLHRDPSSAAQQAHDAWLMIARARVAAAAPTVALAAARDVFTRTLSAMRLEDGACTTATIDRNGQIVREPALLGVDAGEIVAVPY